MYEIPDQHQSRFCERGEGMFEFTFDVKITESSIIQIQCYVVLDKSVVSPSDSTLCYNCQSSLDRKVKALRNFVPTNEVCAYIFIENKVLDFRVLVTCCIRKHFKLLKLN